MVSLAEESPIDAYQMGSEPPSRGPPGPGCGPRPVRSMPDAEDGIRYEIDPDFLEYARRDAACGGVSGGISAGEQAELPWEA